MLTRHDVPDAIWPSDNVWGIPCLDDRLQADTLAEPVTGWGSISRKEIMRGTYTFYVDDYRFQRLWTDPSGVVNSRCAAIIEPNFSIFPDMPPAVALYRVYQKRWLARYWQTFGIRVLVDLNVPEPHLSEIGLLGVPEGWRAYATHGCDSLWHETLDEHRLACEHAGSDDILFVVYGGGQKTHDLCHDFGFIWVMEDRDRAKGRVMRDGNEKQRQWWRQGQWRGW